MDNIVITAKDADFILYILRDILCKFNESYNEEVEKAKKVTDSTFIEEFGNSLFYNNKKAQELWMQYASQEKDELNKIRTEYIDIITKKYNTERTKYTKAIEILTIGSTLSES